MFISAILWLSSAVSPGPWKVIESFWSRTFDARQKLFEDITFTADKYFKKFPCLTLNSGQHLVSTSISFYS